MLPSGVRRSTWRFVIDTMSIDPSGIQPSPDGRSSIVHSVRTSPESDTDFTACA
jgi:hypothetical protein